MLRDRALPIGRTAARRAAPVRAGPLSQVATSRARGLFALAGALALLAYPIIHPAIGLLVLAAAATLRWRYLGRPIPRSPFGVPLGLYLAGAVVGVLALIYDPTMGWVRFFGLVAALAICFLVQDLTTSPDRARALSRAALVAVALALPVLLLCVLPSLPLERLPEPVREALEGLSPLGKPLRRFAWEDDSVQQRFRLHGSGLGAVAALGIGLAMGPLLAGPRRWRIAGLVAMPYFGIFLLLAANRGALLSAALVVLLLAATRNRWWAAGALSLVGLVALAVPLLAVSGVRSQTGLVLGLVPVRVIDPGPLYVRLEFWQNCLYLLGMFPLTGAGLGQESVAAVYRDFFRPIDPNFHHAHNIFMQSALEQGPLGLIGLVTLVASAFVVGRRAMRSADACSRAAAASAAGASLALVLAGLLEVNPITSFGFTLLVAPLGLLAGLDQPAQPAGPAPATGPRAGLRQLMQAAPAGRRAQAGAAMLVLFALGTLAVWIALEPTRPLDGPAVVLRPLRLAASRLYLNLAAIEASRATVNRVAENPAHDQQLDTARTLLARARDYDPSAIRPLLLAGAVQLDLKRSQTAELLRQVEPLIPPGDDIAWFRVGQLYRDAGEIEGAIAAWRRVDPEYGVWACDSVGNQLVQWGKDLVESRKWDQALRVNRAAVETLPVDPTPYPNYTLALRRQGDNGSALAAMEELTTRRPEIPWAYQEVIELYRRQGDESSAQLWNRKLEEVRNAPAWAATWTTLVRRCTYR